MNRGDTIVCVDAPEGSPLVLGAAYSVRSYCEDPRKNPDFVNPGGRYDIAVDRLNEPAVTLNEVLGIFMAKRFKIEKTY